ncbi:hypothetical protein [Parasitella parasitica]|uniref:SH3 domain-containing protein n=1 Tax=Parasitella parasitica TaxID=35722 RepID=A0A0B7NLZ0_9FUNG|nr:hypothetical protein [Parasitella parasitica]
MTSGISHTQQLQQRQISNSAINFKDAFWDDQNKGVEIVTDRLRKSKDTCEELKKLYQLRASIEQDYGERLLKLSQESKIGKSEEYSFAETLSRIPSALETTARAHIDLAQQLKDHLEAPLDKFLKDQRDDRKMQQQHIDSSKQLKSLHEADVARIEKEIEEQRKMVAVAEQVYKRSVDNYNSVNDKWLNDWSATADFYQEMEVKRISYLRSTLWSFANMMTITFSIDEECCDRIRTALEITDVQKDITAFVQHHGTGNRIPGPMSYEIFYNTSNQTSEMNVHSAPVFAAATATAAATIAAASISTNLEQPLSAPLPKTSSLENSLSDAIPRGASESTASKQLPAHPPVTILTNPDEELKSVDRQLQQLEVQNTTSQSEDRNKQFNMIASPQELVSNEIDEKGGHEDMKDSQQQQQQPPLSGVTNTTDQSNGPVSTAMKEVEQILNQNENGQNAANAHVKIESSSSIKRESYTSSSSTTNGAKQTIPPIMMARSIPAEKLSSTTSSLPISDDFSGSIYNALGLKEDGTTSQNDLHKEQTESMTKSNGVVELAPLSSETPIFMPFDSLVSRNESIHSNDSSKEVNQKYKPMPNPVFNNNGSMTLTKDAPPTSKNEMNQVAPETVPNMKPVVGVRTSSLLLSQKPPSSHQGSKPSSLNQELVDHKKYDEDYEENEDEKEYHNRMPRLPPKDEKWVISSIRRPQQLPVRTMNATMFDGTTSSRNSIVSPLPSTATAAVIASSTEHSPATDVNAAAVETNDNQDDAHHHPKPHKPSIPLTIEIPNSVKPTPDIAQNAAQQVIAEGRKQSRMSPVQQNTELPQQTQAMNHNSMRSYVSNQQNTLEEGGIRPAPWQEELNTDNQRGVRAPMPNSGSTYYANGHPGYQPGVPGPRSSSIKITDQQQFQHQQPMLLQQQQHFEENKKRLGKNAKQFSGDSPVKSKEKENKTARFSLGFFSGNKKEKKKEKEKEKEKESAAATAAAAAAVYTQHPDTSYTQQQPYIQQQAQPRPVSQQVMYQKQSSLHELSQSDLKSNHSGGLQQQQPSLPQQQMSSLPPNKSRFLGFAKAQWPFEATIEGEMSFQADEIVGILHKQMDGWWEAERLGPVGTGQRGLVPGNYMLDNYPPPPSLQQ